MGQYWTVVNIDKRQHLGHWGKLGECFFDNTPNTLIGHLAVPSLTTNPSIRVHRFGEPLMTGDWAGDRIICVGDYVQDVPEGVLSDDETREFAKLTRRAEGEGGSDVEEEEEDAQRSTGYINLHTVAGEFFERPHSPYFSRADFAEDIRVLRNLTKREYVRADAMNLYRDELGGPFHRPGLGQVLLSRISWSTDPSASMSYDYDRDGITRGAWAGDRFDIETIDTVVFDGGDAGQWKDVSREVSEEIFPIYTAIYGESLVVLVQIDWSVWNLLIC